MNRRSFIQSASAFFAGLCFWKPKAEADHISGVGKKVDTPTLDKIDRLIEYSVKMWGSEPESVQIPYHAYHEALAEIDRMGLLRADVDRAYWIMPKSLYSGGFFHDEVRVSPSSKPAEHPDWGEWSYLWDFALVKFPEAGMTAGGNIYNHRIYAVAWEGV